MVIKQVRLPFWELDQWFTGRCRGLDQSPIPGLDSDDLTEARRYQICLRGSESVMISSRGIYTYRKTSRLGMNYARRQKSHDLQGFDATTSFGGVSHCWSSLLAC